MFLCVIIFKNGFTKTKLTDTMEDCASFFESWQIVFWGNDAVGHYIMTRGTEDEPNHIYLYWGLEQ